MRPSVLSWVTSAIPRNLCFFCNLNCLQILVNNHMHFFYEYGANY